LYFVVCSLLIIEVLAVELTKKLRNSAEGTVTVLGYP
jgi:hypothetical protein